MESAWDVCKCGDYRCCGDHSDSYDVGFSIGESVEEKEPVRRNQSEWVPHFLDFED